MNNIILKTYEDERINKELKKCLVRAVADDEFDMGDEEFDRLWQAIKEEYSIVTDQFLEMNAFYTRAAITLHLWEAVGLKNMYAIDYSLFTLANDDGKEIHEVMSYSEFCERTSILGKDYPKLILASLLDCNAQEDYLEKYMSLYYLGTLDEITIRNTMIDLDHIPLEYQTSGVIEEAKTYPISSFGPTNEEIVEAMEAAKKKIRVVALLDTLEYLRKGGRISNVAGFVGGMLSIRPVIGIVDGLVEVLGKARGSKAANNLLAQQIESAGGIDYSMPYELAYSGLDDSLLRKYINDNEQIWKGHADELSYGIVGSTIGTHAGPGAIAVAFFSV